MSPWLARALYSLAMAALAPLDVLRLWWRGRREPLYRFAIGERFGRVRGGVTPTPGLLWLHAVSLGETHAAAALLRALRQQRPGLRLLLTHGTATGRAAGAALLRAGDHQAWLPYDSRRAVRRFLRQWQPSTGVLMETELWPTLLFEAQAAGVPMLLANARLSERSLRRGLRTAPLLGPAVATLTAALAQTEADAVRLRRAGVPRVEVMGNLKFDVHPEPGLLALGQRWAAAAGRPVVVAASTRDGEEAALLAAWTQRPDRHRARLCLVPRHPQRFDEVAALVAGAGLSLSRRSRWPADGPDAAAGMADVWLGDSVGEMPAYYAAARVALLGGSFAPLGGQNLIEAAACGCPVLMGPHTFNFALPAEQAAEVGAARRCDDIATAVTEALALVADSARWAAMRDAALAFAAGQQGAAARMASAVLAAAVGAGRTAA